MTSPGAPMTSPSPGAWPVARERLQVSLSEAVSVSRRLLRDPPGGGGEGRPSPTRGSSADIRAKASRLSLPLPPLALRPLPLRWGAPETSRGDPDEDDEDEEDEEEAAGPEEASAGPVPLVVSRWDGRGLRGLLKPPRRPPEVGLSSNRKRKAVSFFDDVTVHLFDQETPTNELSGQSGPEEPAAMAPPDGLAAVEN
ncbi:serine/threonine-protein kinase LMTK3-like [Poecile atricapillus]|uniref:serine/threonine-protein kinase LMTK3-like n=1 Tax=Poecile atricapillus TaxID=48891 RepID=UPI00273909BF|nr:serine/threonine-protein kinase LMTK3-like [Poecile atricapillus]